jgi:CelD/BcsL family acetyltransferase involved in cellulose biosynthesis
MRVQAIHPKELGDSETRAWHALRAGAGCYSSPYFHPRFTQIVGQNRPDARVLVIEADGAIVGFWPLHHRPDGFGRPIGQPFSDQNGPILGQGAPPLGHVLRVSGLWGAAFTAAPASVAGLQGYAQGSAESGMIALQQGDDATLDPLRGKTGSHFKSLRRRERRAIEAYGTVETRWGEVHTDTMALLMAWKHTQFLRTGLFDVFKPAWVRTVIDHLFAERDGAFRGVLSTLRFGETPVAMEFGLVDGGHLHSWIAAYDPAYGHFSPGHLLLTALIKDGPGRGLGVIELGMGADYYKKNYVTHGLALVRGLVRAQSVTGALRSLPHRLWTATEDANIRGVSDLFARTRRRVDNIVSAELSTSGRLRGMAQAVAAVRPTPEPAPAD